jgi:hypothetical protein
MKNIERTNQCIERAARVDAYVPEGVAARKIAHALAVVRVRNRGGSKNPMPRYWDGYETLIDVLIRCALDIPVEPVVGNGGFGADTDPRLYLRAKMGLDWDAL